MASGASPSEKRSPSGSIPSIASTLSTILPKCSERAPDELFPAIPPMVQREAVEGSTGKNSPSLRSWSFSVVRTVPGRTRTVRACGS